MENLSIEELQAIQEALSTCLLINPGSNNGFRWNYLKLDVEQLIKDKTFEKEMNPLPFPEN